MAKKKPSTSKPKEKKFWDQIFCDFYMPEDAELFMMALTEESGIKSNKLRMIPLPSKMGPGFSVVMSSVSIAERNLLEIESSKFGRFRFRAL